jgi:outer membrane protein, protease secretion system
MIRARGALLGCLFSLTASTAAATGLLDAYQSALLNDPTLRAARHERDAGLQAPAIQRAPLLPNLSLFSSRSTNTGDRSFSAGVPNQSLDYRAAEDRLTLRQPLLYYEGYVRYQQSGVQAEYSEALFSKKEAELAIRVAIAYFDLLLANEKLALADAEVAAFTDQRRSAQRRNAAGEGTLIEVAETDARLGIAEANRADAVDQLAVARRTLEEMTGKPATDVRVLKRDFTTRGLQPANIDEWLAIALDKSPEIVAQRKLLEGARLDIDRTRSLHWPRLDFVASYSKTENDTLNTLNQQANVRSAGLQLTIPIFSGLGVVAQTRQAEANRERTASELDATISKVQLEVRRWFMAARTGAIKVAAYDRAVTSSTVTVDGTRRGMAAGVRTNTEVLDAQRLLFSVLRDRAQARYEHLTSMLKLKAAAGALSESDITEVDTQLEPQGSGGPLYSSENEPGR